MSALRVAFVLGTTSGGTGRHVAMLAAAASTADGVRVKVLGPPPVSGLFQEAGAVEFSPVTITDRPRPASDVAAIRLVRRLLASWQPDVVHAHGLRAGALAALAGPSGVPLIVTVHNAPPDGRRLAAIYGVLERVVARRASVVLCVSPDLEARMRRLGARSVQRAIVPAPAPAPGPPPAAGPPSKTPVPEASTPSGTPADSPTPGELAALGRPLVLGAGRLAPQKAFDILLAAAATAAWRDRQPPPLVVIAGDGPLAGSLTAAAAGLGVDARFLGPRDDIAELLAVADVFVLPSRWEGQPLILQEALRAGRPIVATDVGGVRAVCDSAALLVPPGDAEALGAAVLSVLDDPGLGQRLGATAWDQAAALPAEADAVAAAFAVYRAVRAGHGTD